MNNESTKTLLTDCFNQVINDFSLLPVKAH